MKRRVNAGVEVSNGMRVEFRGGIGRGHENGLRVGIVNGASIFHNGYLWVPIHVPDVNENIMCRRENIETVES